MAEQLSAARVSAIIIFLNEERFIQEAIESVLSQGYQNWELLLVDDGSSDGSSAIARRYAAEFPGKIRYLDHPGHQNRGMSASRNLGVRHGRGAYVAFLDADDVWLPNKLAHQVAILDAQPEAALVHGPLLEWYSWSGNRDDHSRDRLYGVDRTGVHPYADSLVQAPHLLRLFLAREEFIPSGVLVRREAIERVGGSEDVFRGSYEDAVLYVKICLTSPVYVVRECSYQYRIHPGSWERTTIRAGQANAARLRYLYWVQSYLRERGVTDAAIWRALSLAILRSRHPWLRLLDSRYVRPRLEMLSKWVARRVLPVPAYRWLSSRMHSSKSPLSAGERLA
jgi:glycosyltransferase involved in cell wall biosynthesis